MTVSTTISKSGPYNSGTTGPFSYAFYITDEDELRVILTPADGVETDLTLTTDYTVAGVGEAAGGTVTLVEAPDFAGGELLTLKRAIPQVQETELRNQGAFYPAAHEAAFDRLTMMVQDLSESVERSVKVQVSSDTDPDDLVDTIIAAERSASVDAATATTKAGEAAASAAAIALPIAIASGGTGATTAANARTALGLGTAATKDTGTATGNVVVLEDVGGSPGLPAVDGSQLTGITGTVSTADLVCTATDDDAAAGDLGEYIESVVPIASAIGLTAASGANVTSISLTAGDWDVSGMVGFVTAANTNITVLMAAISTATANPGAPDARAQHAYPTAGVVLGVNNVSLVVPTRRISVAATTTVYLVAQTAFTVDIMTACGRISARRVR